MCAEKVIERLSRKKGHKCSLFSKHSMVEEAHKQFVYIYEIFIPPEPPYFKKYFIFKKCLGQ